MSPDPRPRLTILSAGYPFVPVVREPVGGAERVLACLDRALVEAGERSIVIAPAGSRVAGTLLEIPAPPEVIDERARLRAHDALRRAIGSVLEREAIDLIHLHGVDCAAYLPPEGIPVLITLHLPAALYPAEILRSAREGTWLNPVSASQARTLAGPHVLPPIENGVEMPPPTARTRRSYALALGRICPEKGFDEALDAARLAGCPLLLAGCVMGHPEHERYFRTEIVPRLDRLRRFIGPVGGARKQRLLAGARCLLVPSRIAETSSLAAMEALAAGTPVVAYRAGALPEIVEDGATGLLAEDPASMARAIEAVRGIDPERCRRAAQDRFALGRMTAEYLALYRRLTAASARAVSRGAESTVSA